VFRPPQSLTYWAVRNITRRAQFRHSSRRMGARNLSVSDNMHVQGQNMWSDRWSWKIFSWSSAHEHRKAPGPLFQSWARCVLHD